MNDLPLRNAPAIDITATSCNTSCQILSISKSSHLVCNTRIQQDAFKRRLVQIEHMLEFDRFDYLQRSLHIVASLAVDYPIVIHY